MAQTTFANARGIVHKGSGRSTIPGPLDVCKTPTPGGPVPMPYANVIDARASAGNEGAKKQQKQLKDAAKSEGYDAQSATQALIKKNGDEAGTQRGMISSKNRGKVDFSLYSFDVKFEDKNVCRLGDSLFQNQKNIVP